MCAPHHVKGILTIFLESNSPIHRLRRPNAAPPCRCGEPSVIVGPLDAASSQAEGTAERRIIQCGRRFPRLTHFGLVRRRACRATLLDVDDASPSTKRIPRAQYDPNAAAFVILRAMLDGRGRAGELEAREEEADLRARRLG